jgi:antitoxin (DNA-binding transcriptional repressor) of toxin-antitoxin stability system
MIHIMKTATIRQLRTQFPTIRRLLEQEGQVVVTERGRPVMLLRPYREPLVRPNERVDYYARLRRRMPKPLSAGVRRAWHEADRDER